MHTSGCGVCAGIENRRADTRKTQLVVALTQTQFCGDRVILHAGDCLDVLDAMAENSVDAVVTDPPYHFESMVKRFGRPGQAAINNYDEKIGRNGPYQLASKGFMGKEWDGGDIAFRPDTWARVLRVLKPGGHIVAFGAPKNYHRLACAIEDAGFELRDSLMWIFGTGFPKSYNLPGGFGTALKPAYEPIVLARKPLSEGTVAANVLRWGTGALNIDATRVSLNGERPFSYPNGPGGCKSSEFHYQGRATTPAEGSPLGRWPANVVTDGSEEVVEMFPVTKSGSWNGQLTGRGSEHSGNWGKKDRPFFYNGDEGSAARFFYSGKAGKSDRIVRDVEEVCVSWISDSGPCQARLQMDTGQSLERAIVASGSAGVQEWSTFLFGSTITDLCRTAIKSTIETRTNSTIELKTLSCLTRSLISACIQGANCETASGLSLVVNAERFGLSLNIILGETVSLLGASRALSKTPLKISVSARRHSHPTTKPVALMQWLVRMVTPPGGTVLDPFAGSGTTGHAALLEGFNAILIEREEEYRADIERRMASVFAEAAE